VRRRRPFVVLALAITLALSAGIASTSAAAASPAPAPVSHAGRWIVDASGRVVIDHGFNVVAKVAPYEPAATGFSADDAQFLASHGFTAVRLGVLLEGIEPQPGVFDDS
jgi:endoglycosylceramidase